MVLVSVPSCSTHLPQRATPTAPAHAARQHDKTATIFHIIRQHDSSPHLSQGLRDPAQNVKHVAACQSQQQWASGKCSQGARAGGVTASPSRHCNLCPPLGCEPPWEKHRHLRETKPAAGPITGTANCGFAKSSPAVHIHQGTDAPHNRNRAPSTTAALVPTCAQRQEECL